MRENIGLYRGKWIDNGEWALGALVIAKDAADGQQRTYILEDADYCGYGEFTGVCYVAPETVGECSGIPDKNGKLIFEGDVLKVIYLCQKPVIARVTFRDGKYEIRYTRHGNTCIDTMSGSMSDLYEIIGNIHDNPELLGGNSP